MEPLDFALYLICAAVFAAIGVALAYQSDRMARRRRDSTRYWQDTPGEIVVSALGRAFFTAAIALVVLPLLRAAGVLA